MYTNKINILLLFFFIFLSSCSNQEEGNINPEEKNIITKSGLPSSSCNGECLPFIIVSNNTSSGQTFIGWQMSPQKQDNCIFQIKYSDGMNTYPYTTTHNDFILTGTLQKVTVTLKCLNNDCKNCSRTYSYTKRPDGSYDVEGAVNCHMQYKVPNITRTGSFSFKILPPNYPADTTKFLFPDRYTYAFTDNTHPEWSDFGSNPGTPFKPNEIIMLPDMSHSRYYSLILFSSKCPDPRKHYIYCNLPYQNPNAIDFTQFVEVKRH